MAELINKVKEHAVSLSLFSVLTVGASVYNIHQNNQHETDMANLKFEQQVKLDSIKHRTGDYEAWNNNKIDERECADKKRDSLIHNKNKCNS